MSRFIEVLDRHRGEVTMRTMPLGLSEGLERPSSKRRALGWSSTFPYFIERAAPASGAKGLMDYQSWFHGESNGAKGDDFLIGVRVPSDQPLPVPVQGHQRLRCAQSARIHYDRAS